MSSFRRVLMIVEDDPSSRGALASVFSRRGWAICSVGTHAEAMTFLDHGLVPDCLVLDLKLPDGDGEDILRKVRESGLATRVAVCTGMHDENKLESIRAWKPDRLMVKPIDLDELQQVCR